jgi:hypothetical protein
MRGGTVPLVATGTMYSAPTDRLPGMLISGRPYHERGGEPSAGAEARPKRSSTSWREM